MTTQFSNAYALLIAIDDNLIPNYALPDVAKDAAALKDVLIDPQRCAYPPGNVRVLSGPEATRDGILSSLGWLREKLKGNGSDNANASSTAVIYYSGHGARDAENTYYLLPYDTRFPVTASALRATDFAAAIAAVRPGRLLVVLDCCHAGGLDVKGDEIAGADDPVADAGLVKSAVEPTAKGLNTLIQGAGRAVLSSSTGDQKSYIRPDRAMSIFTYHLVEALTGHAQPPEGATEVLVSDVMGYVTRHVAASARAINRAQTPSFQVSGENFPIALLLGGKGLAKGESPPDPLQPLSLSPQPSIDTGGGAYVGGPVNTGGGDFTGRDRVVHGDEIRGSKFEFSGNFSGAILNIQSRLQNVTQSVAALPTANDDQKAELTRLIEQLKAELANVPPQHTTDAELVARRVTNLVDELKVTEPDQILVKTYGERLRDAAARLASVLPRAVEFAANIATLAQSLTN